MEQQSNGNQNPGKSDKEKFVPKLPNEQQSKPNLIDHFLQFRLMPVQTKVNHPNPLFKIQNYQEFQLLPIPTAIPVTAAQVAGQNLNDNLNARNLIPNLLNPQDLVNRMKLVRKDDQFIEFKLDAFQQHNKRKLLQQFPNFPSSSNPDLSQISQFPAFFQAFPANAIANNPQIQNNTTTTAQTQNDEQENEESVSTAAAEQQIAGEQENVQSPSPKDNNIPNPSQSVENDTNDVLQQQSEQAPIIPASTTPPLAPSSAIQNLIPKQQITNVAPQQKKKMGRPKKKKFQAYRCKLCSKLFLENPDVVQHMQKEHADIVGTTKNYSKWISAQLTIKREERWKIENEKLSKDSNSTSSSVAGAETSAKSVNSSASVTGEKKPETPQKDEENAKQNSAKKRKRKTNELGTLSKTKEGSASSSKQQDDKKERNARKKLKQKKDEDFIYESDEDFKFLETVEPPHKKLSTIQSSFSSKHLKEAISSESAADVENTDDDENQNSSSNASSSSGFNLMDIAAAVAGGAPVTQQQLQQQIQDLVNAISISQTSHVNQSDISDMNASALSHTLGAPDKGGNDFLGEALTLNNNIEKKLVELDGLHVELEILQIQREHFEKDIDYIEHTIDAMDKNIETLDSKSKKLCEAKQENLKNLSFTAQQQQSINEDNLMVFLKNFQKQKDDEIEKFQKEKQKIGNEIIERQLTKQMKLKELEEKNIQLRNKIEAMTAQSQNLSLNLNLIPKPVKKDQN